MGLAGGGREELEADREQVAGLPSDVAESSSRDPTAMRPADCC